IVAVGDVEISGWMRKYAMRAVALGLEWIGAVDVIALLPGSGDYDRGAVARRILAHEVVFRIRYDHIVLPVDAQMFGSVQIGFDAARLDEGSDFALLVDYA